MSSLKFVQVAMASSKYNQILIGLCENGSVYAAELAGLLDASTGADSHLEAEEEDTRRWHRLLTAAEEFEASLERARTADAGEPETP